MTLKNQILTLASLFLLAFVFSADAKGQGIGIGNYIGPQVPQVQIPQAQVQPAVQPPVTNPRYIAPAPSIPLGVMTQFISLQRPIQLSGQGGGGAQFHSQGHQVAVSPPVGGGGSWAYYGYRITNVTPGGVAQRAGLEVGDIILSLNNLPMTNQYSLRSAIKNSQGRTVSASVLNVRTGMPTVVYCTFSEMGTWPGMPHTHQQSYSNPQPQSFGNSGSGNRSTIPGTLQGIPQAMPQGFSASPQNNFSIGGR